MKDEIYKLTEKAFETDHVVDLLKGAGEYAVAPNKSSFADQPTDWSNLIRMGIIPYCMEDITSARWKCFLEAVKALINGSAVDVWYAYNIYYFLAYAAHGGNIMLPGYVYFPREDLHAGIGQHIPELMKIKKWSGTNEPEGLWGDIYFADLALERRYPGSGIIFHRI